MRKCVSVLFVASEAEPFFKTGSLADLAGSLPKTIKAMGHDIRVMLPAHKPINSRRFAVHNLLRMKDILIPIGAETEQAYVKSSYLNGDTQKVQVYFLANDRYFNRDGLYSHPETKKYFPDNDERFIFFCRGVLETLKRLGWQPDIIHCNDWQCGLIPAYLKTIYRNDPFFRNIRTVFTAHTLASHATFPRSSYDKAGLPMDYFAESGMEAGKFNFLQAGLALADVVTTLGAKADKGICVAPHDGMEKILQGRKNTVISIPTNSSNDHGQEIIAQKFIDVYRDLLKTG